MSYAQNIFTTTSPNETNFVITWTAPYYMTTADVKAEVDKVAWTVVSVSGTNVTLATGIPTDSTVRIYRETDVSSNEVDFLAGSPFRAGDVNLNFDQTLFAIQEALTSDENHETDINRLEGLINTILALLNNNIQFVQVANVAALDTAAATDPDNLKGYEVTDSTGLEGANPEIPLLPPKAGTGTGEDPVTGVYWNAGISTKVLWDKANQNWIYVSYFASNGDNRYQQITLQQATAPVLANFKNGTLWFNTTDQNLYVLYDDAGTRSWVLVGPLRDDRYVNRTGDSMTGNLLMNNADVVFEGSTDDGFETTLTVTDPTADNSIVLPDVSGNVVTTGDTGTVTSTMIADGTIVDADVNASAAIGLSKLATGALPTGITVASANIVDGSIVDADINSSAAITLTKLGSGALPSNITVNSDNITNLSIVNNDVNANAEIEVSKLANGTARQLLQTDAAGTGVEFTSNVDVPGTLDVTGNAVFDGSASFANYVESTNGAGKAYLGSSSIAGLEIVGSDTTTKARIDYDGSGLFAGGLTVSGGTSGTANAAGISIAKNNSNASYAPLYLSQASTSGNLITGVNGFTGATTFTVGANGAASFSGNISSNRFSNVVSMLSANVGGTQYGFAVTDASSNLKAGITSNGAATFAGGDLEITSGGQAFINTDNSTAFYIRDKSVPGVNQVSFLNDGSAEFKGSFDVGNFKLSDNTQEGLHITSGGVIVSNRTTNAATLFQGRLNGSAKIEMLSDGSGSFAGGSTVAGGSEIKVGNGQAAFVVNDGYGKGTLAGSAFVLTNTSGTNTVSFDTGAGSATFTGNIQIGGSISSNSQRSLTLGNQGYIQVRRDAAEPLFLGYLLNGGESSRITGNGSATFEGSVLGKDYVQGGIGGNYGLVAYASAGTGSNYTAVYARNYNINGRVWCGDNSVGSTSSVIYGNGNASFYGTVSAQGSVLTSDARFKTNITPAGPQLADVVRLGNQLKNWNWTEDAPVTDKDTRFLGLIAQELEEVCPTLVTSVERTKQGKELTPEQVIPAVYEDKVVPAEYKTVFIAAERNDEGEIITPRTTEEVLITPEYTEQVLVKEEEIIPATYEELDDSYKAIKSDVFIMKLLGAVAELTARVEELEN